MKMSDLRLEMLNTKPMSETFLLISAMTFGFLLELTGRILNILLDNKGIKLILIFVFSPNSELYDAILRVNQTDII